ncbi:MAG: hypothetical protein JSS43_17520 [Proteobacteria bacterium]|nr:hypothetical protein [Pseudomonadota bacterium]
MDGHFVKLYVGGLDRLQSLFRDASPTTSALWLFLVRRMLAGEQAVVVSASTLACELAVTVRSVERAVRELRSSGAVEVRRVGNANCYIINSDEVWKGADVRKHSAAIRAVAVVGFRENPELADSLADRIAQPDLPGVLDSPVLEGVSDG